MVLCIGAVFPATGAGAGMFAGFGRDGANANLIVREVRVTPARARVGEIVRIDMAWEYWGDMSNNYYEQTEAQVLANGKVVARKPFFYAPAASLGDIYRETFEWDTREATPGIYRIRGEVPLHVDVSSFDNYLDVKTPLVLLSADASDAAVGDGGGSAVAANPRLSDRGKGP